ncbi:MAG: tRNA lysidine(34) synthetase TilS [Lentisphaeria bacterium]|nr:MAG: tRNA lysidine(34) synthetase TilS [Lentisphaeria bacterium]
MLLLPAIIFSSAFSGGADSTVALLACLHARNRFGCPVTAIHFEHGLRGEESRQDAAAARDFAENSDVPFREIPLGLSPGPGLEERARAERLAVWRQLVTEIPEAVVVLGHHADDAVETLFLRLARGANVSGLVGMRPVSRLDGMTILRPLLAFARAEIEAYLRARDIQWRTDSSNQENTFSRNALRNIILPEFRRRIPGSSAGLLHSSNPSGRMPNFWKRQPGKGSPPSPERAKPRWSSGVRCRRHFRSGCSGTTSPNLPAGRCSPLRHFSPGSVMPGSPIQRKRCRFRSAACAPFSSTAAGCIR